MRERRTDNDEEEEMADEQTPDPQRNVRPRLGSRHPEPLLRPSGLRRGPDTLEGDTNSDGHQRA
eukprot:5765033-Heterocapsa_arctica.AAC.1